MSPIVTLDSSVPWTMPTTAKASQRIVWTELRIFLLIVTSDASAKWLAQLNSSDDQIWHGSFVREYTAVECETCSSASTNVPRPRFRLRKSSWRLESQNRDFRVPSVGRSIGRDMSFEECIRCCLGSYLCTTKYFKLQSKSAILQCNVLIVQLRASKFNSKARQKVTFA